MRQDGSFPEAVSDYAGHGRLTDPGKYRTILSGLPLDVPKLCQVVQGVLIHDASGGRFYGDPPDDFHLASRATLPVAERIDAILTACGDPITVPRRPFERSVGTCRDFALMLCAMLREHGAPARVRCGFAAYLKPSSFADHWVCEYWKSDDRRWAIADAQLDAPHRAHLSLDFDIGDLPEGAFLSAWQAWRMYRSGAADPHLFGHGDDVGAWFIQVNLARDLLSLCKREASDWDAWRDAKPEDRELDKETVRLLDRMAELVLGMEGPSPPRLEDSSIQRFLSSAPWAA